MKLTHLRLTTTLALALFAFTFSSAEGSLREKYWCLAHMLEKQPLCGASCEFDDVRDLDSPDGVASKLPTLHIADGASNAERVALLRGFAITNVTAAPGHVYLRNPKQLKNLKEYITSSGGGNFGHDPLLFNLITDSSGKVLTIDLWNAHHRLVAFLEAGYHFLDEIPEANFKILVNGKTAEGATWPHFLSIAGLDDTKALTKTVVPPGGDIRVGTVAVDGHHPNFHLGARNSIGQLRKNMLYRKQPKIGIYFGSFDPPHAGHLDVVKRAIAALGLDEVIIVPNARVVSKPGLTPLEKRIPLLRGFIKNEPRINLYVGDSGPIVNEFGRDPFIERMVQTYATHDITQIIGEDSYLNLIREGNLSPTVNRKYLVLPRPGIRVNGVNSLHVPDDLKSVVTVLEDFESRDLSSTRIRQLYSEGNPVDESILPLGVQREIDLQGLYRKH